MTKLDKFTEAYLVAALWSSTQENGEPLDEDYDIDDIAPETLTSMVHDCANFQRDNEELMAELDSSQCGHDFWLTRCGHGAGFWDRGYGDLGDKLTDAAQTYGNVDLYIGDDNLIYQ